MKKDILNFNKKNDNENLLIPIEMHGNGLVDNSSLIVDFEEYI